MNYIKTSFPVVSGPLLLTYTPFISKFIHTPFKSSLSEQKREFGDDFSIEIKGQPMESYKETVSIEHIDALLPSVTQFLRYFVSVTATVSISYHSYKFRNHFNL